MHFTETSKPQDAFSGRILFDFGERNTILWLSLFITLLGCLAADVFGNTTIFSLSGNILAGVAILMIASPMFITGYHWLNVRHPDDRLKDKSSLSTQERCDTNKISKTIKIGVFLLLASITIYNVQSLPLLFRLTLESVKNYLM